MTDLLYFFAQNTAVETAVGALFQIAQSFFDAGNCLLVLFAGEGTGLETFQTVANDFQQVIITQTIGQVNTAAGALLETDITHDHFVIGIHNGIFTLSFSLPQINHCIQHIK